MTSHAESEQQFKDMQTRRYQRSHGPLGVGGGAPGGSGDGRKVVRTRGVRCMSYVRT